MSGINIPITVRHNNEFFEDGLAQVVREGSGLKKVWRWFQEEDRTYRMKSIVNIYSSSLRICRNKMYEHLGPFLGNELEVLSKNIVRHEDTYWLDFEEESFMESENPSTNDNIDLKAI